MKARKRATIALTLVILLSSILLFGGIALVASGIDVTKTETIYNRITLSTVRAKACQDEAVLKLVNDSTYTGNGSFTYSNGNCTFTISNVTGNANLKKLVLTSSVDTYNYSTTKGVDLSTNPYTVSFFQSTPCSVTYYYRTQWPAGYTVDLTITNNSGVTLNGWTLQWTMPTGHGFAGGWNANFVINGQDLSATNMSWNNTINNGSSYTGAGFNGSTNNDYTKPTSIKLNGNLCTIN